jgi:hypothetical protein
MVPTRKRFVADEMNHYRLTFRDEEGKICRREATASTMRLAVQGNINPYELIQMELPLQNGSSDFMLKTLRFGMRIAFTP